MTLDPSKDPNQFFRAKLGGGQAALRILLAQKPRAALSAGNQASEAQSDNQSRVRNYRRTADELVPKKKGAINFYDLGQVKNMSGDWVDLDFWVKWNDSGNDLVDPHTVGHAYFYERDWHDLADLIHSVAPADWKTTYRKLTYEDGEKYGVDLRDDIDGATVIASVGRAGSRHDGTGTLITGAKWTPKGLKLTSSLDAFAFQDWGLFFFLCDPDAPFGGPSSKVTTVYDPTAASVPFTLSKGSDVNVYLFPRVVNMALHTRGTTNAFGTTEYFRVAPFRAMSRLFWLDRANGTDFLPNIFSYNARDFTLTLTNSTDLTTYLLGLTGVSGRRITWPSSTPTVTDTFTDPAQWDEALTEQIIADASSHILIPPVESTPSIATGILTGVIEQGGMFYYFWRTDAGGPNWVAGGGPVHTMTLSH